MPGLRRHLRPLRNSFFRRPATARPPHNHDDLRYMDDWRPIDRRRRGKLWELGRQHVNEGDPGPPRG